MLIIDDLLATGGTAKAAAALVNKVGASVALFAFVIVMFVRYRIFYFIFVCCLVNIERYLSHS